MKLAEALKNIDIKEVIGAIDAEFNSIEYDSRKISNGAMFVALKGLNYDGHNFIPSALEKGASVILCENAPEIKKSDAVYVVVASSRKALAGVSHAFYDYPTKKMKIFGVTGTNGKTTVTYLLKSILDVAGYKTGLIGTTGIIIGNEFIEATHTTPESLELCRLLDKMQKAGIDAAVMEVSSHALHQSRADFIDFDGAIFTNLSRDHLDYHKTYEEYAAAKKILFDSLKEDAVAIAFADGEYGLYMLSDCRAKVKALTGRKEGSDIIIRNENQNIKGNDFELEFKDRQYLNVKIETRLSGAFNIENAAFCASLALLSGIKPQAVTNGLKNTNGAPGRMQLIPLANGAAGIVDYAHTPDALEKALKACRNILIKSGHENNKLICVFGAGGDRDAGKRPIMGALAADLADIAIITNDNPRFEDQDKIIIDIKAGINKEHAEKVHTVKKREDAVKYAVDLSGKNDLILVAGKGHENYQIIGDQKFYCNDAEYLQKYA